MSSAHRIIKRLVIISVYIILVALLATAIYYIFRAKPTCEDKIQNQGEEGVDCGGPCAQCEEIPDIKNVEVLEEELIIGEAGAYDALAKIVNPNPQYGIARLEYSFNVMNGSGEIVSKKEGTTFLLPAETKYVVDFNIPMENNPTNVDFKIQSFQWSRFLEYEEPNINIYAKQFDLSSGGDTGFAKLVSKIRNQSGFDFRLISAIAVIRNGAGNAVAVNKTNVNDVRVNEEREIFFNWNSPFAVDPISAKIEIDTEVNVFENDNFMKKHGSQDQYKSYNTNR